MLFGHGALKIGDKFSCMAKYVKLLLTNLAEVVKVIDCCLKVYRRTAFLPVGFADHHTGLFLRSIKKPGETMLQ